MNTSWLEKPLGPLPVWGWAVALGGAVIAFIILPKVLSKVGGQTQDATSGTSTAGLGIDPSTGLPTSIFPGGGTVPSADQSNMLTDLVAQQQAITNGQQAMQDEFKTFLDVLTAIRNQLTPPVSPPPTPITQNGPPGPPTFESPPAAITNPGPVVNPPPAATPVYTVRSGDTLSQIAARYGLSTSQVAAMNTQVLQQYAQQHGVAITGTSRWGNYPRYWDYIYPGETLKV